VLVSLEEQLPVGQAPAPQAAQDDRDAQLWDELLLFMDDRQVVPVIGRDLVTLEQDGQHVRLDSWLAARLAEQLGVPIDGPPFALSLNEVASRYLATGGDPENIYYRLHKIYRGCSPCPVPEPLKKLASIRSFSFFVSTTFDPLLARAINEVRFGGVEYTREIAYSPREKQDLPADLDQLDAPVVYHLLGKLSPSFQDYVVTEEDALEFVHSLQSSGLPVNASTALTERPLLIIGCSFPGWLVRFFLRVARRNRLLLARGKTDFVVDARAGEDSALVGFLRTFKTRTQLFQQRDPIAFVDDLHRRWHERAAQQPAAGGQAPPADIGRMSPGAVFLSYASEDRPAAQAISDALDAAGLDVWFDRDSLFAGDPFEPKIRLNIERCSLFMPVLSRSCVTPARRFFRIEWDHAQRVARTVPASTRFIVPVVIDDLPHGHEDIPEGFRGLHWESLAGGRATPSFVSTIKQLYRDYQTRTAVRA